MLKKESVYRKVIRLGNAKPKDLDEKNSLEEEIWGLGLVGKIMFNVGYRNKKKDKGEKVKLIDKQKIEGLVGLRFNPAFDKIVFFQKLGHLTLLEWIMFKYYFYRRKLSIRGEHRRNKKGVKKLEPKHKKSRNVADDDTQKVRGKRSRRKEKEVSKQWVFTKKLKNGFRIIFHYGVLVIASPILLPLWIVKKIFSIKVEKFKSPKDRVFKFIGGSKIIRVITVVAVFMVIVFVFPFIQNSVYSVLPWSDNTLVHETDKSNEPVKEKSDQKISGEEAVKEENQAVAEEQSENEPKSTKPDPIDSSGDVQVSNTDNQRRMTTPLPQAPAIQQPPSAPASPVSAPIPRENLTPSDEGYVGTIR